MNSQTIDLIYLDPPFNSNKHYAAPIGSQAAGAEFKDTWNLDDVKLVWHGEIKHENPSLYFLIQATREIHGDSTASYLIYMTVRLLEMKRLLKDNGTIYLHCDPTTSHYLKLAMDAIFGKTNFRNEIVWSYRRWPSKQKNFQKMHDIILRYSKGSDVIWNQLYDELSESSKKMWKGKKRVQVNTDHGTSTSKATTEDSEGPAMRSVWNLSVLHPNAKERVGYPTQKPKKLLQRIIQASSNPKDMVLDPFCGCATTCLAAEEDSRHWIGIDISPKASQLVQQRLDAELPLFTVKHTHLEGNTLPTRTDQGKIPPYNSPANKKWLYGEQDGYCLGCKTHFEPRNLTIDHIVPKAKAGTDHISNLQLLCNSCNSIKGTLTNEEMIQRLIDKGYRRA